MSTLLDDQLFAASHDHDPKTILRINEAKIDFNEGIKQLNQGRTLLVVMANFSLIGGGLGLFLNPYEVSTEDILLETGVLVAIYGVCAWLYPRQPVLYLGIAIAVYVLFAVLAAAIDPATLGQGWIWKIIIAVGTFRAVIGWRQVQQKERELVQIGVPASEPRTAKRSLKPIPRTPQRISIGR